MPELDTLTRRTILANPVRQFANQSPDATSQQKAAVSSLAQRYTKLESEHNEIKLLTQQLSRQIGQAKKDGEAVDEHREERGRRLDALDGRAQEFLANWKQGKTLMQQLSLVPSSRRPT